MDRIAAEVVLPAGTTIGGFEVLAALGAGGMGEVYRARDSELGREVALKVLSPRLSNDADALARFEREAKVLASLNHPNIASIFGVARGETTKALVLELVPGATLADLIATGPLPLERALRLAEQIADALDAAHERAIIHRDLKPANIKITDDGTVKVLDFGLAKALDVADAAETVTHLGTEHGVVLGTRSYMSPEQARGLPVDRRADVWAFGCVLFEILSGKRTFQGPSATDITVAVLEREPDWAALPARTPASVRRLLLRALEKDPRRRLRDIADARADLHDGLRELSGAAPAAHSGHARRRGWLVHAAWLMLVLSALALGIMAPWQRASPPAEPETHVGISLPPLGTPPLSANIALSHDGRKVAFTTVDGIWIRDLKDVEARLLRGTASAMTPAFSPDDRWIAFLLDKRMKRMPVDGTGDPMPIGDVRATERGFSWGSGDVIYFGHTNGPISKLSINGGPNQPVTTFDTAAGETSHRWPHFIAESNVLLYAAGPSITANDWNSSHVVAQSLETGKRVIIAPRGSMPAYSSGYLFYLSNRSLLAQQFDPARVEVSGPVITVLPDVARVGSGGGWYSVSKTGTLAAYQEDPPGDARLVWLDRKGGMAPLPIQPGPLNNIRLSPDGSRVAVTVSAPDSDVWTFDVSRGTGTRITNDGKSLWPIWSADNTRLLYTSTRGGPALLRTRKATGSGADDPFVSTPLISRGTDWAADGLLVFFLVDASGDLFTMEPGRGQKAYAASEGDDIDGRISPDGKWLAFRSDRTGRNEIYVDRFPQPTGEPVQVSRRGAWSHDGGGVNPVWSHDGKEVFFLNGNRLSSAVMTSPIPAFGEPQQIVDVPLPLADVTFDVAKDGRFLFVVRDRPRPRSPELLLTFNIAAELRRRSNDK